MSYSFDNNGNIKKPGIFLCDIDKNIINGLKTYNLSLTKKWNDYGMLNFDISRIYIDTITGEKKELKIWEDIDSMYKIYLKDIGYFNISTISNNIVNEADVKTIECFSSEYELSNRKLNNFVINKGVTGSIDGVSLCNTIDTSKSLLHLALADFPHWTVGHVDESIKSQERSFEIDDENVYNFLCQEVADTFKCVFIFDTINNTVNVYDETTVGSDTNIYISKRNLAKEITIDFDEDNIKTMLKCVGSDDVTIHNVNYGSGSIIDLTYYHTVKRMGQSLYDAYATYLSNYDTYSTQYTTLSSTRQTYYNELSELNNNQPDTDTSDLTQYGLSQLKTKLSTYETLETTYAQQGFGSTSSNMYSTYSANHTLIANINSEITVRENQISAKETQIDTITNQMNTISSNMSFENNFTNEQQLKLNKFLKEDTYSDDCFEFQDNFTESDKIEVEQALLDAGKVQLSEICKPQLTFTMSMENILALKQFKPLLSQFEVGNYLYVEIRKNYVTKVRLLEYTINFDDLSDFSSTFGNINKYRTYDDIHNELMKQATQAGKTVANSKSHWQKASNTANDLDTKLGSGYNIDLSTTSLKSTSNMDIEVGDRGIILRQWNTDKTDYLPNQMWLTGNKIILTDDAFASTRMALGQITIESEDKYGIFADFVVAGYIEGSDIVGSNITGGTIVGSELKSTNYVADSVGTKIALDDGNVDIGGKLLYSSSTGILSVNGNITVGGNNNVDGQIIVNDASGNVVGKFDKDGLVATNADISGTITALNGDGDYKVKFMNSGINWLSNINDNRLGYLSYTATNLRKGLSLVSRENYISISTIDENGNDLSHIICDSDGKVELDGNYLNLNKSTDVGVNMRSYFKNVYFNTSADYGTSYYAYFNKSWHYGNHYYPNKIAGQRIGLSGDASTIGWSDTYPLYVTGNSYFNGNITVNGTVYYGSMSVITSDRNYKKDIEDIGDKYIDFYKKLQPKTYKYIDGTSERTHIGLIAQDVEQALLDSDLTTKDFAGFVRQYEEDVQLTIIDEEGNETVSEPQEPTEKLGIRYEEFISLNTLMIQKLLKQNEVLENKITSLEEKINKLTQE